MRRQRAGLKVGWCCSHRDTACAAQATFAMFHLFHLKQAPTLPKGPWLPVTLINKPILSYCVAAALQCGCWGAFMRSVSCSQCCACWRNHRPADLQQQLRWTVSHPQHCSAANRDSVCVCGNYREKVLTPTAHWCSRSACLLLLRFQKLLFLICEWCIIRIFVIIHLGLHNNVTTRWPIPFNKSFSANSA